MKKATNVQVLLHKFSYSEFLQEALKNGWEVIPYVRGIQIPDTEKVLVMGHRVTEEVGKAKEMARLEFNSDCRSTYFAHTLCPDMVNFGLLHLNYLWQLNHEANLLVDCVDVVARLGLNVHEHIIGNIVQMARFGIISKGIGMYDDSEIARKSGFKGTDYFFDFSQTEGYITMNAPGSKERLINFGVHPLAEYGLAYEETHITGTHIISDYKGQMTLDKEPVSRKKSKDRLFTFLREETGKTIVSFNPAYWNI